MTLNFIVTVCIAAGLLLFFRVNPVALAKRIFATSEDKPQNIQELILAANGNKKSRMFSKAFAQMQKVLALTGRAEQYQKYCGFALTSAIAGIVIAIALDNLLLLPLLAAFGLLTPPLYILVTAAPYAKRINTQAGTAVSMVTSTYIRTENFPLSVKSNLPIMRGPIKKVFTKFWTQTEYVSADVEKSIQDMSGEFQNDTFREWCKVMELCQHDRSQIGMLQPLLNKQHNIEIVQIAIDSDAPSQLKDCRSIALLVLASYGLLAVYNMNCLLYMFTTIPGKVVTAGVIACLFFLLYRVVDVLKPIRG